MAGMLPGVECARRRRCYQGADNSSSSSLSSEHRSRRRTPFCLYQDSLQHPQSHSTSRPALQGRVEQINEAGNSSLQGVAREAKERLDEKLRAATGRRRSFRFWTRGTSSHNPNNYSEQEDVEGVRTDEETANGLTKSSIELLGRNIYTHKSHTNNNIRNLRPSWKLLMSIKSSVNTNIPTHEEQGLKDVEDCAVCLDTFHTGQAVIRLGCNHRFHWACLAPWLISNSHCPCCRNPI